MIFDDGGKVLLERRTDNDFWGLPGGAVEVGESVEQAVKREVMEETALRVESIRFAPVSTIAAPRTMAPLASQVFGLTIAIFKNCFLQLPQAIKI